jgi:DNA-directed RNA polymerase subunit RPC12/RpoP
MFRQCSRCGQPFTAHDLCKDISKTVEAQRLAGGVEGVAFRVYTCPRCEKDDLFVDVTPLPGESIEAFHQRKEQVESLIHEIPPSDADIVIAERPPR